MDVLLCMNILLDGRSFVYGHFLDGRSFVYEHSFRWTFFCV
jgi:hypothetical protein